jgi:hypothetical protein
MKMWLLSITGIVSMTRRTKKMRSKNKRARHKSLRRMDSDSDNSEIVTIGKSKSPVLVSNLYDNQLDKELDEALENEK